MHKKKMIWRFPNILKNSMMVFSTTGIPGKLLLHNKLGNMTPSLQIMHLEFIR